MNEKSSGMVSPRIPPGGRSQIQFGWLYTTSIILYIFDLKKSSWNKNKDNSFKINQSTFFAIYIFVSCRLWKK